jgi:SnoaL-like domain
MTKDRTPVDVAVAFIQTMPCQDMATAATYLADDVVFEGPLTRFTAAEPYLEAMGEFAKAVIAVDIVATIGDDERAMIVYEMRTRPFGTLRAMEYFTVRDGRIRTDTLVFDTHKVRQAAAVQP